MATRIARQPAFVLVASKLHEGKIGTPYLPWARRVPGNCNSDEALLQEHATLETALRQRVVRLWAPSPHPARCMTRFQFPKIVWIVSYRTCPRRRRYMSRRPTSLRKQQAEWCVEGDGIGESVPYLYMACRWTRLSATEWNLKDRIQGHN